MSASCTRPTPFIFTVLAHWKNSLRVNVRCTRTPYFDSDANRLRSYSLAVCLTEKQHKPIWQFFSLTRHGLKPKIYRTQGEYSNNYTTLSFFLIIWLYMYMFDCLLITINTILPCLLDFGMFDLHQCTFISLC